MTSELEQEFFDTFGIENRFIIQTHERLYPEITAEKLLELICIYNNNVYENERITPLRYITLKEDVLHWFIIDFVGNDKIKHQIQQLFNEDDRMIYIETTMLDIITDEEEY